MAASEDRDPSPLATMDLAPPADADLALLADMAGADPLQVAWARGQCLNFLRGAAFGRLDLSTFALTRLPDPFFADPRVVSRLDTFVCSANELEALPRELAGCQELRELDCSRNRLGALPAEFFAPGALPKLQSLYAGTNRLVQVPAAPPGALPALRLFDCGENRLGALPEFEDGGLPALHTIICTGNDFTALPASLGRLGALAYLHCAGNFLADVPAELGRCGALRAVYFGVQRTAGAPPGDFGGPSGMLLPGEEGGRADAGLLAAWLREGWAAAARRRRVKPARA